MSALERWNPLTPLAAATFLVVVAYTGPQPASALAAFAAALAAAWSAGHVVGRRVSALVASVALPTWLLLVIMNAFPAPRGAPAPGRWGVSLSSAALGAALLVALRLGAAVGALGLLVTGIAPRRLTKALAERGLPAWAAYVLVASLEAVPEARHRAREVMDAQRCRGLATGGKLTGRLFALVALAGPLAVSLVTESEDRALALDARGFEPRRRRTALSPIPDPPVERRVRAALWIAVVALLAWRAVTAWRGAP